MKSLFAIEIVYTISFFFANTYDQIQQLAFKKEPGGHGARGPCKAGRLYGRWHRPTAAPQVLPDDLLNANCWKNIKNLTTLFFLFKIGRSILEKLMEQSIRQTLPWEVNWIIKISSTPSLETQSDDNLPPPSMQINQLSPIITPLDFLRNRYEKIERSMNFMESIRTVIERSMNFVKSIRTFIEHFMNF